MHCNSLHQYLGGGGTLVVFLSCVVCYNVGLVYR